MYVAHVKAWQRKRFLTGHAPRNKGNGQTNDDVCTVTCRLGWVETRRGGGPRHAPGICVGCGHLFTKLVLNDNYKGIQIKEFAPGK